MNNPLRSKGMADVAFVAYDLGMKNANIDIYKRDDLRVVQALGNAPASAGFHKSDGILYGVPYTAAVDVSVKGLSNTQIATVVEELCRVGFSSFYRNWPGNLHIHGDYAGVPQKPQLDRQQEDFFAGKDGLAGHRRADQEWWYPSVELRAIPERMFRLSNPARGAGVVVPCPLPNQTAPKEQLTYGFYLNDEARPRFWMPVFDGVAMAPVRAFGAALGLDVEYQPATQSITFEGKDQPIALKLVSGVGHAPIRQLVGEVGLRIQTVDAVNRKVVVTR